MASGTFSADATANDYNTALSLAQSQARSEAFSTLGQNISFDRASTSDTINPNNTYTVTFTTTATQVEVPTPVLTSGDAALGAVDQEVADLRVASESSSPLPVDPITDALLAEQAAFRQFQAEEEQIARLNRAAELDLANSGDPALTAAQNAQDAADLQTAALTYSPAPVSTVTALDENEFGTPNVLGEFDTAEVSNAVEQARQQSTLQDRVGQVASADWRVRISLADNANYLYKLPADSAASKESGAGILFPLQATNGVVFPYTPTIDTSYQAKYDQYDLVHSNYRGYFYRNSFVENIMIKGTFTAQDTREAQYLLAVIHFFRSVTKMFYGQDAQAGAPPPLVYLNGLGQYQFNKHPCVVTSFNYNLPNDVDYIRADGFNNIGLNMSNRRNQSSGPAPGGIMGILSAVDARLAAAGLTSGSLSNRPNGQSQVNQNVSNQSSINSTYVPTKMEISVTLLPMQTRSQVSKQFSLRDFANGALLKGGFW